MWETRIVTPLGRISVRNLLSCVAAMLVTVFLYNLIAVQPAFAADASWNGESLVYNSNQYTALPDSKAGDSHNLPVGSKIYGYVSTDEKGINTAHLIYFDPNIDPKSATSAHSIDYNFTPPDHYSNPSPPKSISLDQNSANKPVESCQIKGIGWLVCTASNWLAGGMDWIFSVLSGFIAVQPTQLNQANDMYRAWDYMRSFANIAFVIAFLFIIYSQLTSIGLSNYSLKKLLPRLIIAAILVNVSYYLCAAAIDLSNILGYAVQKLFMGIRGDLFHIYGNTWTSSMVSWTSVTGFVLSGGTAVLGAGIGIAAALGATGGTVAAAIFLLLPMLLGLILGALVVMLILAARQAIIVILVIIAPLAFVAYLLPNTEKLFEKWRKLFITMLVFFPAFSMVFAGAQVAAAVIIQNATSINMLILGMAVQVAPLFISPLLLKLSGSLLGRIAGVVNNPNKGILDRTRKWAGEHADYHRKRGIGDNLKTHNFLRRGARGLEYRKRQRERGAARWDQGMDEYTARQAMSRSKLQHIEVDLAISKLNTENAQNDLKRAIDNLKAGDSTALLDDDRLRTRIAPEYFAARSLAKVNRELDAATVANEDARVLTHQLHAADHMQQHHFAQALKASAELRERAGGIDPNGPQRALASATTTIRAAHAETIKNANSVIDSANLGDDKTLQLAYGRDQIGTDGRTIEATADMVEAAIGRVASSGNVKNIMEMVENLDLGPGGGAHENYRLALTSALKGNSMRPKFYGFGWMGGVEQGVPGGVGKTGVDAAIQSTVNQKKFSAETIVGQDKDALSRVVQTFNDYGTHYFDQAALRNLKKQIDVAYATDQYKGRVAERDTELKDIMAKLDAAGITYGPDD